MIEFLPDPEEASITSGITSSLTKEAHQDDATSTIRLADFYEI
jgi:hypothetical protein